MLANPSTTGGAFDEPPDPGLPSLLPLHAARSETAAATASANPEVRLWIMAERYRAPTAAGPRRNAISAYLAFLLLGLGAGAVYAVLALGLVLVHRASGVLNFAQGALAMYVTYVYAELRDTGDLVLPVIGVPHRLHLSGPASFPLAFGLALGVAALLGLLVHALVFRPLRTAPALSKVVASVGLMGVLQALATLQFGPDDRIVAPVLSARPLSLFDVTVPSDRLLLAAVAGVPAPGVTPPPPSAPVRRAAPP